MICGICKGSGVTIIKTSYKSDWHGEQEDTIEQKCYKCGGTGETNETSRFSESSNQQQIRDRFPNSDDGLEK